MNGPLWGPIRDAAERNPERVAVSAGGSVLRYAELVAAADAVTAALVDRGVVAGDRVVVLTTKSVRAVAALVGIMQAGAAYVPVDVRAPNRRIRLLVEDAEAAAIVTDTRCLPKLSPAAGEGGSGEALAPRAGLLLLDDDPPEEDVAGHGPVAAWSEIAGGGGSLRTVFRTERDPAYILYTSGSTGTPKGVVLSHGNARAFVDWAVDRYSIGPEDRLSNHAPFHFDLSILDLYGALTSGASVHLVPEGVAPFPRNLADWIDDEAISVWYSVPSALVRLLTAGELDRRDLPELRAVLFAGEVFPVKHLRAVMERLPGAEFHNLYGPTETNVCTAYAVPRPLPDDVDSLPIGRSCAHTDAFVADEDGGRAGPGATGELLVRGPTVMLGYWRSREATERGVVQHPGHGDYPDPVYRTGDRVEVLPDGGFRFLGRFDDMVKVRGYRVELGEVERALLEHPGVREAAAVALEDDRVGGRLAAGVVPAPDGGPNAQELRRHCLAILPRYAVPEQLVLLPALPRNDRGKTDRSTLARQINQAGQ